MGHGNRIRHIDWESNMCISVKEFLNFSVIWIFQSINVDVMCKLKKCLLCEFTFMRVEPSGTFTSTVLCDKIIKAVYLSDTIMSSESHFYPVLILLLFFQLKLIFKNIWIFKKKFFPTMALFHYKLMDFFQNSSLYPPQELRRCWLCRHTVAYTNKHADELQNAPQLKWPRIRSESRRDASLSERIINAHHTYKTHTSTVWFTQSLTLLTIIVPVHTFSACHLTHLLFRMGVMLCSNIWGW